MFDTGTETYKSDIKLGERYKDTQTGLIGVATALYFYQHACERVLIELISEKDGDLKEYSFDAPRLVHVETGKQVTSARTGGPSRATGVRPGDGRR